MKIAVVRDTRPEIIKLAPVIRILKREDLDYFILHTGQYYSYNMDRFSLSSWGLPEAKYNLNVSSGSHAVQTRKMLIGIESVLMKDLGCCSGSRRHEHYACGRFIYS